MNKKFLTIIFIFLLCTPLFSSDKILKIYFFERPPYYYTSSNGQIKGILFEKVKQILEYSNINHTFQSLPSKRIIYQIEKGDYACSPGWYKTEERIKKFKYTLPIFESEKIVAVVNRSIQISDNVSLRWLVCSHLKLGIISGFYYGDIIGNFLKSVKYEKFTTKPGNLLKAVALKRVDYTFYSKDYVDTFLKKYPEYVKKLKVVNIIEIKKGLKRYIICSKKVSDELIEKMNNGIKKLSFIPASQ